MKDSPFSVSVIIPVYNGERFLKEALDNVLNQKYYPLEIIVIDDGSTDQTRTIVNHYADAIRYIYQKNKGPSAARNTGIKAANGNVIAFLDVDDLWSLNKLNAQIDIFKQQPHYEIVQGLIQEMMLDESACSTDLVFNVSSEPYHFLNLGSAIYRKSLFETVGLFDETLKDNEDTDWFIRAWKANTSKKVIHQVTLYYRKHLHNLTLGQKDLVHFGLPKILIKHLNIARKHGRGKKVEKPSLPNFAEFIGKPPEQVSEDHIGQSNFTIISSDCWGAGAYRRIGKIYQSPFIGTKIYAQCFLKLLKNLRPSIESPLIFISHSKYEFINEKRKSQFYPIGQLPGDIEIHFLHETNEEKIKWKWEKRIGRIQWDHIFVTFSEDPGLCTEQMLRQFEELDFSNKVCFTTKEYPQFPSTIYIPNYFVEGAPMYLPTLKYFDAMGWLCQTKGSSVSKYRFAQVPEMV
jgi:uncharacterized protein (DUF1919 family)